MKKPLLFIVFIMILVPLHLKADIDFSKPLVGFIKTDEQGNYINDAEFKIHSVNGNVEYQVWKNAVLGLLREQAPTAYTPIPMSVRRLDVGTVVNDGQYYFYSEDEETYENLLSILGPEERQIVEDLQDYNKISNYNTLFHEQEYSSDYARFQVTRGIDFEFSTTCALKTPTPQLSNKDYKARFMEGEGEDPQQDENCTHMYISVPVIMVLEETKAPAGLKKEKSILAYEYKITYYFDDNSHALLDEKKVSYYVSGIVKYNYDLNYSNILDLVRKEITLTNSDELYYKTDCELYFYGYYSDLESRTPTSINSMKNYQATFVEGEGENQCYNMPIIIDHENGAVLTISSYVNNGGSTKAVKGSEVNYKIVVKNEGTTDSTSNVITSKVPEGFEYIEGSASDNGVYLAGENAVRWNIDVIGIETTKELTYKVSVSEDVDLDKAYVSSATISNDGNDEIVSNETRVILEGSVTNPKTGDFNTIIILFVLCVAGLILYYIQDKKILRGL